MTFVGNGEIVFTNKWWTGTTLDTEQNLSPPNSWIVSNYYQRRQTLLKSDFLLLSNHMLTVSNAHLRFFFSLLLVSSRKYHTFDSDEHLNNNNVKNENYAILFARDVIGALVSCIICTCVVLIFTKRNKRCDSHRIVLSFSQQNLLSAFIVIVYRKLLWFVSWMERTNPDDA